MPPEMLRKSSAWRYKSKQHLDAYVSIDTAICRPNIKVRTHGNVETWNHGVGILRLLLAPIGKEQMSKLAITPKASTDGESVTQAFLALLMRKV